MNARTVLSSARAVHRVCNTSSPLVLSRSMSLTGVGNLPEKEAGEERLYFNKEDEKLLKNILSRVKAQADQKDKHAAAGSKAAELSALGEIVGKYNLPTEDLEALIKWKHEAY